MLPRSTRHGGRQTGLPATPWRRDRTLATSLVLLALLCALELLTGCASQPATAPGSEARIAPILDIAPAHEQALQHMQAGAWDEAHTLLTDITTQDASLAGAWTNLGITRTMLGDHAGAEAAFKAAIDANSKAVEAYNQLGMLYRRHHRLQEAQFIYTEALKLDPDNPNLHWNLAILYDVYLPNPHQALQHYRRYRQITGPGNAQLDSWITALEAEEPGEAMTARAQP